MATIKCQAGTEPCFGVDIFYSKEVVFPFVTL